MKISGTSKIIDAKKIKEEQENIVYAAEATDLLDQGKESKKSKGKFHKVKDLALSAIEKTKPLMDKQKQLTSTAITKARNISPYIDKTITAIDVAINYITKSEQEGRLEVVQETRPPAIFGIWVLIITFGVGMMWAFIAPLDSASHARGRVILESKKRLIQHPEGGIVKDVLVKDGDHVEKGQTLITFEDAEIKAMRQQNLHRSITAKAELDRLTAERDNQAEITFDQIVLDNKEDPEIARAIENQQNLFKATKEAYNSRISLYEKQIQQSEEQKKSYQHLLEAADKTASIAKDQAERYKKLYEKGNVSRVQLQDIESRSAEATAKKGQLQSLIAESEHKILSNKIEIDNFKNSMMHDTNDKIKAVQSEYVLYNEELKKQNERLSRSVLVAPEAGDIANFNYLVAPKSVVFPQQVLLEVIPQDDKMVIEVKIPANDISAVKVGQITKVRLAAYRARIVPLLSGKLVGISADITVPDQRDYSSGINFPYYKGRIEIDIDDFEIIAKEHNVKLFPGMEVDVQIVTGTRTMMRYLLDPITLTMGRAFRER